MWYKPQNCRIHRVAIHAGYLHSVEIFADGILRAGEANGDLVVKTL